VLFGFKEVKKNQIQRKARRKCSAFLYAWMQAQHCWLTLHLHAKTSITDKRPKDQEDDNYDDVVIPATTMRKTCQCMCHECQHMRRKKGLREGGRVARKGPGAWHVGGPNADIPNTRPHIPNLPSRQMAKPNAFGTKGKLLDCPESAMFCISFECRPFLAFPLGFVFLISPIRYSFSLGPWNLSLRSLKVCNNIF